MDAKKPAVESIDAKKPAVESIDAKKPAVESIDAKRVESIDAYIAPFPLEIREILTKIREIIRETAPEASEKISYQMPTFYQDGNLVHFAAFKNHIGFYPTPHGITEFAKELEGYETATGSIQFPLSKPIPYELIRKITAFRVIENREKAAAKKKGKKGS